MSLSFTLPVLLGFAAIIGGGVLDKIPNLRVGFLEAGCLWVHFLSEQPEHRFDLGYRMADLIGTPPPAKRHPLEYLRGGQIYINTECEDLHLPQVVDLIGDDHIILGSDMPHGDREPFVKRDFLARTDLDDAAKQKILWDNGWRFYGLPAPARGTATA